MLRPARDTWLNPALALALCVLAGALAAWLRLPLPWMIGPLVAMAGCNFAGARLRAVPGARPVGQLVIGTALGLYFTPAVAREVASLWPLLLAAAVIALLISGICAEFLARATGTDRTTAFFASVPGGAAEMAVLGERYGARVDRIALAQSLRVMTVVIVVPFALTYSGVHGTDAYAPSAAPLDWPGLALLLALTLGAGGLLAATRLPNALMFGPLAASVALTAAEIQLSSVPTPITNGAQLLIGCMLGARFERSLLANLAGYSTAVLASALLAILAAALAAAGLAWLTGIAVPTLILATAPGGIAEMCITAKVLQLGVPLVTAAHVARVFVLVAFTGPLFRVVSAWK